MKKWLPLIIIVALILLALKWGVGVNNMLVEKEGLAKAQWANVESSYQRRADLIPNLVATVKGYAAHEKETLEGVIKARSEATKTTIDANNLTPENMAQFQQAQQGLTGALSKLLLVVERYPDLKANQNFLELQSQLEGTENRINVERNRFNDMAGEYNITIKKIPTNLIASIGGFDGMPLYKSDAGSENAPKVEF
ncbi:LemA family protein [Mariniflexile gromovii]|uniref:LemA family protein n=1 Tax=Mariniflexile gromovii TaxID=362523 RepID=A0ABS4BRL2_9FLAO|nr:LemA family protein [Mariniflexile gromovii]MBP0903216.1 LemA family protein [Mariniflexile gromovii]